LNQPLPFIELPFQKYIALPWNWLVPYLVT